MQRDPGFKNVVQIAIVCRDIEATSKRWAAILGVEPPKIVTTDPGSKVKMVVHGKPSNAQAKLAFFSTGQAVLELIEPLGGDSAWQQGLDRNGESVHHIAFQVQDVDKSIDFLKEQGYPLIHRGRYGSDNGTYAYVDSQSQLGVMVELLHNDADTPRK